MGKVALIKTQYLDHGMIMEQLWVVDPRFPRYFLYASNTSAGDEKLTLTNRFNWSTPIRTILGDSFALYNEQLTSQTTLEDILSHSTGIPDYFLLLMAGYPYDITRQQLVRYLMLFHYYKRRHKRQLGYQMGVTFIKPFCVLVRAQTVRLNTILKFV